VLEALVIGLVQPTAAITRRNITKARRFFASQCAPLVQFGFNAAVHLSLPILALPFCFITYHSLSEGAQSYCAVDGSDLCSSHEPQELGPNSTFALPLYSVATFRRAQPEMMYRLLLELN